MIRDEVRALFDKLVKASSQIEEQKFKETYYMPLTPQEIQMLTQMTYTYLWVNKSEI